MSDASPTDTTDSPSLDATAGGRLPEFLIIGAAKCGTTSLFNLMADHPEVYAPFKKELWFFNEGIDGPGDLKAYRNYFAGAAPDQAAGEATPGYLYYADATISGLRRAYDAPPKFLIILRDPVRRFWSHYLHNRAHGWELRSFEEVLRDGPEHNSSSSIHHFFAVGRFGEQIQEWFSAFPRSRFQVTFLEDLAGDPESVLLDIFRFLDVRPTVDPIRLDRQHNSAWTPRSEFVRDVVDPFVWRAARKLLPEAWSWRIHKTVKRLNKRPIEQKPEMSVEGRARLADYYRDDVARLQRLLDRPLPDAWPAA